MAADAAAARRRDHPAVVLRGRHGHGPRWLNFNHDTIADLRLDGAALVLSFLQAEPLRLSGELAPWCAAVIAS